MFRQSLNSWIVSWSQIKSMTRSGAIIFCCLLMIGSGVEPLWGQSTQETENEGSILENVVVTATRSEKQQKQLPESTTVLTQEDIQDEMSISGDLGEIVGKHVPGMAPANQSMSNFGQTLRGRKFLTLIDGVPQSTPMRDGARDLQSIDPSSVKRIEIVRGSTSIYGYNATGGVINLITEDPGDGELENRTTLRTGGSEHNLSESWKGTVEHRLRGAVGENQFVLTGKYGITNSYFDGAGDRIPSNPRGQGGLAESDRYQFSGKLTRSLTTETELGINLQSFRHRQDRDYKIIDGDVAANQKTTTADDDPTYVTEPGNENDVLQVSLSDEDFYGFQTEGEIYYQDNLVRYDTSVYFHDQPLIEGEKLGGRLTLDGPVTLPDGTDGNLVWGLDVLRDETQQRTAEGPIITPLMEQTSWAPFAQLEVPLGEDFLLRGGVRHERLSLDIPTFTQAPLYGSNTVQGASLSYNETVGNLGLVWYLNETTDVYASFSQGFAVTEIGRTLRSTSASSVEAVNPEAQIVDSYELGYRSDRQTLNWDLSVFYNESEVGTTYSFSGSDLKVQRLPERIWGLEGSLDYQLNGPYDVGMTASWQEGKQDTDNDGTYETYLNGNRIAPLKFSSYLKHAPTEFFAQKLQGQYWADRNRFPNHEDGDIDPASVDGDPGWYAKGDVSSQILLDYLATYRLSNGKVQVGINNLLDEFYLPPASEARNSNGSFTAGRGRSFQLTYQYNW